MSTIRLVVLGPDGAPVGDATAFAEAFDRSWVDQANDAGSGSLTLDQRDPWVAELTDDCIVACYLDGRWCFDWLATRRSYHTVATDEEAGQVVEVSGKGRGGVLERAAVYPEGGVGRPQTPDSRPFDYSANDYVATGWQAAGFVQQGNGPTGPFANRPDGMPDAGAQWIWHAGHPLTAAPAGHVYFRKKITLSVPVGQPTKRYSIYASAADGMRVLVDGREVLGDHTQFMWATTQQVYVDLAGGDHIIAIEGYNDEGAAGVILTMYEVTNGGADLGQVVTHTDITWRCLGYPAEPPGMTPGKVMTVLLAEAAARGTLHPTGTALDSVTVDFTATTDSNGDPWAGTVTLSLPVGTDYLAVLNQLSDLEVDWKFTRTAAGAPLLRMFNAAGGDRATILRAAYDQGAGAAPGGNLADLVHVVDTEPLRNALLSRYRGSGVDQTGWREDVDAGSVGSHGRREVFLSAGPQPADYVAKLAEALFVERAAPTVAVTAGVAPRPDLPAAERALPYFDYEVGEWIHAPDPAGVSTRYRVRAITVSEDEDGVVTPVPELSTVTAVWEERLQRWLKRMAPGGLFGLTFSAAPVVPPVVFDTPSDPTVTLDTFADISDVPPNPGEVLAWDDTTGQYVPTPLEDLFPPVYEQAIPHAKVYRTTDQAFTSNTDDQQVKFDTVGHLVGLIWHADTWRIEFTRDGWYLVQAEGKWAANPLGTRTMHLVKNHGATGERLLSDPHAIGAGDADDPSGVAWRTSQAATVERFSPGDTLLCNAMPIRQDAAGIINNSGTETLLGSTSPVGNAPWMAVSYLGPAVDEAPPVPPTPAPLGAPHIGTAMFSGGDGVAICNWSAPDEDGGNPITGYQVRTYRAGDGSLFATDTAASIFGNSFSKYGLPAAPMFFKVAAVTSAGIGPQSAASNTGTP